MIVTCQTCAQPLELPDVPAYPGNWGVILRRALLGIAEHTRHEQCAELCVRRYRDAKAEAVLVARMQSVETLIPPLYQDTDESRLTQPWHKRAFAWEFGARGLVLYGDTNTGKTRVAFAILKREHLKGRNCGAYTHSEFVREATRAATDSRSGPLWIETVCNLDLLLVDDFGKVRLTTAGGDTSAATGIMFDVIDSRCKNLRPSIITTNITGDVIEKQWGDHGAAMARRMREFNETIHFKAI